MKIKAANVAVPEIDMTPMIDIVFQLITFFMVINNFDQNEADERVSLPGISWRSRRRCSGRTRL